MSRRTFTNFDTELNLRMSFRGDITSEIRGFLLNDAMYKIGNMYVHRELQEDVDVVLASGDDNVALGVTDLWFIEFFRNVTDNFPLRPGDLDQIEALTKPTAPPRRFYTRGTTLYVDTMADSDKTIRMFYTKKPAQWSSGVAPYDEVFDPLILMWAVKIGFETVRDFDQAKEVGIQISIYNSGMKLPLRQDKLNDANTGIRVRTR